MLQNNITTHEQTVLIIVGYFRFSDAVGGIFHQNIFI